VQFHPEFSGVIMSEYIHYRSDAIRQEGLNPEELNAGTNESIEAKTVLRKFVELVKSSNTRLR
jgi:hypothetical protein